LPAIGRAWKKQNGVDSKTKKKPSVSAGVVKAWFSQFHVWRWTGKFIGQIFTLYGMGKLMNRPHSINW